MSTIRDVTKWCYDETMAKTFKHVNVRFPPELHEQAVALAEAQHRSLNGLILALVEQALREAKA